MKKLPIDFKIETERCIIEMPKLENAIDYYKLCTPAVSHFMTWDNLWSVENYEKFIISKKENWEKQRWFESIVKFKHNSKMIWCFWIARYFEEIESIEIWYWLAEEYWGKWIIPECLEKMKEIAFDEIWCKSIKLRADKNNFRSRRVAEKCWFKLDWILRQHDNIKWKLKDISYYSLLKEEYKNY